MSNSTKRKHTLRPYAEWHEDYGPVLWWRFPIQEEPYVGGPNSLGFSVGTALINQFGETVGETQANIGGDADDGSLFWEPITVPIDPRTILKGKR